MNIQRSTAPRHIDAAEAAAMVKSGDWVEYGSITNQTDVFDKALAERAGDLSRVSIRNCLSMRPRAVAEVDSATSFFIFSWHFSGYDRKLHDRGRCTYIPCNLGEIPDYYRRFLPPVDVAVIKTAPEDENGFFNFGPAGLWHHASVERARIVIVEESPSMPWCHGPGNGLHRSEVDFVIRGDDSPVPVLPSAAPTEVDRAVGRLIAAEIEDGACLQIGIGGMPNAVCASLLDSGAKDLGIHTEMLTDGLVALVKSGQVTSSRKALHAGKHVFSFAAGTEDLYRFVDRNNDFLVLPVDQTNPPAIIQQNPRVVAINNTTQIDLQGQAASESDGHRHISGTGGQAQFVRGSYAAPGGKSFICLSSCYEKNGVRKSRIVPRLTSGNVVTSTRSDMMYVVTEYGIVNLKGMSIAERAHALIGIAHPDFREELEREAYECRLIPRGYF
jgi:acyl-CoA hydrolase